MKTYVGFVVVLKFCQLRSVEKLRAVLRVSARFVVLRDVQLRGVLVSSSHGVMLLDEKGGVVSLRDRDCE